MLSESVDIARLNEFVARNTEKIWNNIENLYIGRGYNQTTFGEALGWSQGKVSHVKRGRNKLSMELLVKAAKVLNVDPLDLMQKTDFGDKENIELIFKFHEMLQNKKTDPTFYAIKKLLK